MGKSKELATLTDVGGTIDDAVTIKDTTNTPLNLTTTGLGASVAYTSSTTTSPWYTGITGASDDSFIIYQDANAAAGEIQLYTNGYERMTIDQSGRVTMPYQPAFQAYANTTFYGPGIVNVWSEALDIGNNFASNRFTAPVAGTYQINYTGLHNVYSSGYYGRFYLFKNGSAIFDGLGDNASAGPYVRISASLTIPLQANDYLEIYIDSNAPSYYIYGGYTHWSGHLVG